MIALRDIEFDVMQGKLYCLHGANCAGKSTLINLRCQLPRGRISKKYAF